MTSPRRGLGAALLAAAALLVALAVAGPAQAATEAQEPRLHVTISGLSPAVLTDGDTVTLSGTVTNRGEQEWTSVQAYLVAPRTPFTTRQQITAAVESGTSYTGERRVDLESIDELGTLAPGATLAFRVRVPFDVLDITGAEGVYPVGVQLLGTAEDGSRSGTAIGRATTFLPSVDAGTTTPTGLVVPFVMPDRRTTSGYVAPLDLVERVSDGGQLRRLLDLARSVPEAGLTVVVDPALLVALDDLANGRRLPEDVTLTDPQRAAAAQARDDLVELGRSVTCWVLGYARPDVLAFAGADDGEIVSGAVDRATITALDRFGLSGRTVTWPTAGGVTESLLAAVRGDGERPVMVQRSALPDWEPRLGSVLLTDTTAGPVPLLVASGLDEGLPGARTVTTVRQRLLAESALSSLERSASATSRADAVAVIDPTWDPGPTTATADLAAAFDPDFVRPVDLETLMTSPRSGYRGDVAGQTRATPVDPAQVRSVAQALEATSSLAALLVDDTRLLQTRSARAAELVSVTWRDHADQGVATARAFARSARSDLTSISVEGPPAVTLSSTEGSFPITVTNGTDDAIEVGLRLSSTNPRLSLPDVDPVTVEAGERRTLTVNVDVGEQSSSTFSAVLLAGDGATFGEPAVFNVRSSRVGAAVWVAMGAATVFVVLALLRRFTTGRRQVRGADLDAPDRRPT
ncbi:DUF6049 family protein [Aeromicrobium halocynthiae]|uniref:DUF6049 family protein n=1 Tax=Aeromicrobium halocynthiae TaxID=560557 RepID=UPI0031E41775